MRFLILTLSLPFLTTMLSGQDLRTEFLEKWTNAKAYTIELAESMPAEHYAFQPTEDISTFEDLLRHLVQNMVWLSNSYLGNETKFPYPLKDTVYQKADLLQVLEAGFDYAYAAVESLDPNEYNDTVDFFAGPKTKRQILILLNDHVTHHRGQAIVYLRLQGVKPPRYRGW
ncbi:MAG: DinB family protein [Bacteroidota bacterium]